MFVAGLPADWTSLRLKISAFNPSADYQQVGILAYQHDDTYVSVRRNYNSEPEAQHWGHVEVMGGDGSAAAGADEHGEFDFAVGPEPDE